MNRVLPLLLATMLTGCATVAPPLVPVGHQPQEEAAVLAALDDYMRAISANDLAAMAAQQTPEGMTYRHLRHDDGRWELLPRSNADWVAPERKTTQRKRERYWSPTVLIRGSMALVWTPHEFWIDDVTTHCGIDVFSFAKVGADWKVSNSMWTVEPASCGELRPTDRSQLRPADPR